MTKSKLSTKDISTEIPAGAGVSKTLTVGNNKCKINGISLEEFALKPGSYHVILHLEGPEIPDFEGFLINKDDPSMGSYKGQVAKVKADFWAFSDATTKGGTEISRDIEILKFYKKLAKALGIEKWLAANDDKHETIEAYTTALNNDQPFAGKFIEYCIAGKEYKNKGGYTAYDLYLPKFTKGGAPFAAKEGDVIMFNETEHIIKQKVAPVSEFGNDMASPDETFLL